MVFVAAAGHITNTPLVCVAGILAIKREDVKNEGVSLKRKTKGDVRLSKKATEGRSLSPPAGE